ncbi:MAG: DUF885 domain-containing protein [Bacteroidales bacterium]|nr:DUF885 domain-containing protein [Candidatus Latescibacterota bacterium]
MLHSRSSATLVGLVILSMVLALLVLPGCASREGGNEKGNEASMNRIAERYVRLTLALGQHDKMYVDAYYGPDEWQKEAESDSMGLAAIGSETGELLAALKNLKVDGDDELLRLRHSFLARHIEALATWVKVRDGERFSFDQEAEALYDSKIPTYDESYFAETLAEIDRLLPPGEGNVQERLEKYREDFIIPKDKVAEIFTIVLEEARTRTKKYIELPEGESFEVEYVTGTSWGAYNWYKGNARSLIQVNTDLPTYIDSPLGLAAHEGYPGHHVYNALLEKNLARERGWVEYSVYPLFSPLSFLAEGTANYGIEVAFPSGERLAYERDVLYPLAGIDPERADEYARIQKLAKKLSRARIQSARMYLDQKWTREETIDYLSKYSLLSRARAGKVIDFFDEFRSYIINYYVGYDVVKEYIEGIEGTMEDPALQWKEFEKLLSTPRVPSGLS